MSPKSASQRASKAPKAESRAEAKRRPTQSTPKADLLPLRELDQLAAWLSKAPINEVEIEQKGLRLRMAKAAAATVAAAPAPLAGQTAPGAAPAPAVSQPLDNAANIFKSPMVGTFYRSASPESQPFVKIGDSVQVGQTLCIIEAMKTMNQIASDRAGKVTKVLIENANPVEFGQPLFVIE